MAEYIEREALLKEVESRIAWSLSYNAIYEAIQIAPAADVVEVCRCGECERRNKSADLTDSVYCPWLKLQMRKTDFCSYGERRAE